MVPLQPGRTPRPNAPLGLASAASSCKAILTYEFCWPDVSCMMVDEAYPHRSQLCSRSGSIDQARRVTKLCSSALTAKPMDIKVPTPFEEPESGKGYSGLERQPDRRHVPPQKGPPASHGSVLLSFAQKHILHVCLGRTILD